MRTAPDAKLPSKKSRFIKRAGQVLVVGGMLTLASAGLLQPYIEAMRSVEGVYIPEARYQFTTQEVSSQNKTLLHTFALYNGRAQPLQIEASADCGCTGLSWQNTTLPPFGRKQITASMESKQQNKSINIYFKLNKKQFVLANLELERS